MILFPSFQVFSQAQEKHPDSYYVNSHISGIVTNTIVYSLDKPLPEESKQACQNYLSNYGRINLATISDSAITMVFNNQVISNEQIYLFIQRLEMNYIYKHKHR